MDMSCPWRDDGGIHRPETGGCCHVSPSNAVGVRDADSFAADFPAAIVRVVVWLRLTLGLVGGGRDEVLGHRLQVDEGPVLITLHILVRLLLHWQGNAEVRALEDRIGPLLW